MCDNLQGGRGLPTYSLPNGAMNEEVWRPLGETKDRRKVTGNIFLISSKASGVGEKK